MSAIQTACSLPPKQLQSRLQKLSADVAPHIRAIERTKAGFAFALPTSPTHRTMAEDFISFERDCCGFARFSLRPEPGAELQWVEVEVPESASPQAQAAVRDMYTLLERSARPGRWLPSALLGSGALFAVLCCATPALAAAMAAVGLGHAVGAVGPWFDGIALVLTIAAVLFAVRARRRSVVDAARSPSRGCGC